MMRINTQSSFRTESLAVFPVPPNGPQEQALLGVKVSPFFVRGPLNFSKLNREAVASLDLALKG